MSKPDRLRPVGLLEKYSISRSHLGLYNNVAVTASYIGLVDQKFKTAVFNALTSVIAQHPILSAVPAEEATKNPYFVRLPEIDISQVVTFAERPYRYNGDVEDVHLNDLLEAEHNQPFRHHEPEIPFWRLIVLVDPWNKNEFMALFVFHHSLADTGSGVIFHECFTTALSDSSAYTTIPKTVISIPDIQLLPPLEILHPLPVSEAFSEIERSGLMVHEVPESVWSSEKTRLPMYTRFRSVAINADNTQRFISICKAQHTSVTATLQTIVASTLFDLLPEQYTTLVCNGAVSLRRWLSLSPVEKSMGCWVGSFLEKYQRQSFSWDECRRARQTIELVVSKEGADMPVGCFQFIEDFNEYLSSKIGEKRSTSFEMSNVGVLSPSDVDGSWKLGRVLFSQSVNAVGGAFKVSVATGNDLRLNLGFSWQKGILEESFIDRVVQSVSSFIVKIDDCNGTRAFSNQCD